MPLYEYQCDACGHRFEMIQKFSDPPLDDVSEVRRRGPQADSSPAFQFKGSGWYITDYARRRIPARSHRRQDSTGRGTKDRLEEGGEGRRAKTSEERKRPTTRDQDTERVERTKSDAAPTSPSDTKTSLESPAPDLDVSRASASRVRAFSAKLRGDVEVVARTSPRDRAGAARSRPPPSGSRACCRCRGGRP